MEGAMSIHELLTVLPAPAHPNEAPTSADWELYETITGITLPEDYQTYLRLFGTGSIGYVIIPYNPFCRRPLWQVRYTCRNWLQQVIGIVTMKQELGNHTFPYPLYPQPDGLLPWGQTDNGDQMFWYTHGPPEAWTVLVNEVRSAHFEAFDCSMTAFLHGIITRSIYSTIIQRETFGEDPLFTVS
jgi:hypothetical protein